MRISAQAIWNGCDTPHPGRIAILDGRIEQVLPPGPADLDLGEAILCAGFVNAHLHLDLSLPRPTETMVGSFDDWLRSVVEARQHLGEDGLTIQAAIGAEETLAGGTTAVFDIDPAGHSITALTDSPLRRLILREVISVNSQPGVDLDALGHFLGGAHDPSRELRGISPHSSYTVHPELLAKLLPWCREQGAPWAMHVAEPTWERQLLVDGRGEGARFLEGFGADPASFRRGHTMIEALRESGDLTRQSLIIHGNECSDDELAAIGESGSALVWCPRSHAFFGRAPHPAPRAAEEGLEVLLGTDGKVSAGTLSMLDEMGAARAAAADLDIETIWKMAIVHPRQWLARAGHPDLLGCGTLQPGDPADLVAVSIPEGDGPLLERALAGEVIASWIDGRALQPEMLGDAQ
ncbi:MAG: amidohydrolase family protein [Planctomycetota bacterium]|nr:amidohydrolase family protein [Planctomycetota bacterium]